MPRIALLQLSASQDRSTNIAKTTEAITRAADGGAQIICTQELFDTTYFCATQSKDPFDHAQPVPGPLTEQHQKLAEELGVVIVASGFEKRTTGIYHNTAWVIDADGSYLGKYRKTHIPQDPGFEEKYYFTPSEDGYKVFDTKFGKLGVLICWDQWYPEAARITALMGAEILIYPTAIGWLEDEVGEIGDGQHDAWLTMMRSHAIANGCFVAAINRTGIEEKTEFWGQSFVCDQFGKIMDTAPEDSEHILYADIDLENIQDHRCTWPFFRDRRIDTYGEVIQRFIDEPESAEGADQNTEQNIELDFEQ